MASRVPIDTPSFDTKKEAKTTGWQNNCGLNCFVHKVVEKLKDPKFDVTLLADKNYQILLECFSKYYGLQGNWRTQAGLNNLRKILTDVYSSPVDHEMLLAPVLRLYLRNLLEDMNVEKIWESPPAGIPHEQEIEYRALVNDFSNFLSVPENNRPQDRMISIIDERVEGVFTKMRNDYFAERIDLEEQTLPKKGISAIIKELKKPGAVCEDKPYSSLLDQPSMSNKDLIDGIILKTAQRIEQEVWRRQAINYLGGADTNTQTGNILTNVELLNKLQEVGKKDSGALRQAQRWNAINALTLDQLNVGIKQMSEERVSPADKVILDQLRSGKKNAVKNIRDKFIKDKWLAMEEEKIKIKYMKAAKELFKNVGKTFYAENMGDIKQRAMTTEFELIQLSDALNIKMEIYKDEINDSGEAVVSRQMQHSPQRGDRNRRGEYGKIKIRHKGVHWQYESNKEEDAKTHNAWYTNTVKQNLYGNDNDPVKIKEKVQKDLKGFRITPVTTTIPAAPVSTLSVPLTLTPQFTTRAKSTAAWPSKSYIATPNDRKLALEQVQNGLWAALEQHNQNKDNDKIKWKIEAVSDNHVNIVDKTAIEPEKSLIATVDITKNAIEYNFIQPVEGSAAKIILESLATQNENIIELAISSTSLEDVSEILVAITVLQEERSDMRIQLTLDPKAMKTFENATSLMAATTKGHFDAIQAEQEKRLNAPTRNKPRM